MENRQDRERTRIRAARYVPGRGFAEGIDRTLNNLPRRECTPLRKKLLAASSIAAALLLLAFAAPPVVRAASELYQRLFGEVVEDIEAKQALPEEQKLAQLVEESERWWRGYPLEGASAEIGDVAVSVDYVRVMAADNFDEDAGGEQDLTLTYSKIPSFDPSWVDFVLVVDGKEIPMRIDETVKTYRDQNKHTMTEAEWANEWSMSNSELHDGVPTTWLWFNVDDWKWDHPNSLS